MLFKSNIYNLSKKNGYQHHQTVRIPWSMLVNTIVFTNSFYHHLSPLVHRDDRNNCTEFIQWSYRFVFEVRGYLFLNGAFYSEQTKLRAIKGICNKKVFFKSYIELKNRYLQTREKIYKLNSR